MPAAAYGARLLPSIRDGAPSFWWRETKAAEARRRSIAASSRSPIVATMLIWRGSGSVENEINGTNRNGTNTQGNHRKASRGRAQADRGAREKADRRGDVAPGGAQ